MAEGLLELTAASFDEKVLKSEVPVLVEFYTTRCPYCVKVVPTLEALAEDYGPKLVVGKLNAEENHEVAAKYRISGVPTMILFHGGEVADRVVGAAPKEDLKAVVDKVVKD